jgi:hypothetical protein
MRSTWQSSVIVAVAPIFVDDAGVACCSMSFTIAPTTDVRSLFLFDEFFDLLEVTELPAFLRAERITSLVVVILGRNSIINRAFPVRHFVLR